MKITVLTDNTPSNRFPQATAEHGLSLFIEYEGTSILCDTGLSSAFMENAAIMGIAVENADFIFLSHGHNDHSGGLKGFLQQHPDKPLFLHPDSLECRFFSTRRGCKRDISSDSDIATLHAGNIRYITKSTRIDKGITAITGTCNAHSTPYGNIFLTKEKAGTELADDFSHELALAFESEKGLVIISPCSHRGAVNIIEDCILATGCKEVYAFIGGLHFVESEHIEAETATFNKEISSRFPHTRIITGHCTCDKAKAILAETMAQVSFFATGGTILIQQEPQQEI